MILKYFNWYLYWAFDQVWWPNKKSINRPMTCLRAACI